MSHPLIKLSQLMNWEQIERSLGAHFASNRGRPALRPRLVAGLLYLQHANDASDEAVVATWLENPYWVRRINRQGVSGESPLQ
jgi:IS5 family transposase